MTGNTRVDVSSGWPFALQDLELYHIVVFCSKKIYFIGYNAAASSSLRTTSARPRTRDFRVRFTVVSTGIPAARIKSFSIMMGYIKAKTVEYTL